MEEQGELFPEYKKGFNQGYILAKEVPELKTQLDKLPEALQDKPRMQGMRAGMQQYHKDKYLEKVKSRTPANDNAKTKSKGMNRN